MSSADIEWYTFGIDNGLQGYACLYKVTTGDYKLIRTPLTQNDIICGYKTYETDAERDGYDFVHMIRILRAAAKVTGNACLVGIEAPVCTFGRTSSKTTEALALGRSLWSAAARLAGISPVIAVAPSTWHADMGLIKKVSKKPQSVALAKSFGVVLPKNKVNGKLLDSDDAADAYNIARWLAGTSIMAAMQNA